MPPVAANTIQRQSAIFAGPISGASMNPARSFAPALAAGELGSMWIYVAGPVGGMSLAALCYRLLRGEDAVEQGAAVKTEGQR